MSSEERVNLTAFLAAYPAYGATAALDELRARDYGRLDATGQVYLDYTGGGLYGQSQLDAHLALLSGHVFGNPHSHNPTSQAMTELVEQARASVLDFCNGSPDEYVVIFTPNASGALKLVGESYPFGPGDRYLLTYDNHNSVNGIREFARARGAEVTYLPMTLPDLRLDADALHTQLAQPGPGGHNLLAYPAQSNFTGVQHSLDWIAAAQEQGWEVLMDGAAFVPTNRLDLSRWRPDFVPLSFYKIFGYPTGVGCLLARRSALARLRRPWFAGGTITIASVQGEGWHYLAAGEAGFEDGTVNYLSLPAVEIGLRHIAAVGVDTIHTRVTCLTGWLLDRLQAIYHANGASLVQIHGPRTTDRRGATIAFSLLDPRGLPLDYRRVEALAGRAGISLRSGCFCNPGAGETAHGLSREEMAYCFRGQEPVSFDRFFTLMQEIGGKSASTLRISVGLVSNFADVERFLAFVANLRNVDAHELPEVTEADRQSDSSRDSA